MQAHTLGEVGNLSIVLLRVYSGTVLPIFIEIGLYLTDKEQNICWHSFFETRCICSICLVIVILSFSKLDVTVEYHVSNRGCDDISKVHCPRVRVKSKKTGLGVYRG